MMLLDAGSCPIRVFQAEAPHTDDSTLVEAPGERTLFLGDSTCGTLPEWTVDPASARKLAETVRKISPEICLTGHWTPLSPEEIAADLEAVGLDVHLRELTWNEYVAALTVLEDEDEDEEPEWVWDMYYGEIVMTGDSVDFSA